MSVTVLRTFAVSTGAVTGIVRDGVVDVRGIRYGFAPRGAEVGPPDVAQAAPASFPQTPGLLDALLGPALGELEQGEDAFGIRIQAPADASGAPVLLFIHGGGFTSGSPEARWYDAHDLVAASGIVLVTVGYRLGALGVLSGTGGDGSGLPVRDLDRATRWVAENIAAFGGDPAAITIAGDSAGAWFAHALSLLPWIAGRFARTLLVSMPRMAPLSGADHTERAEAFASHLAPAACDTAPVTDVLAAQRQVPPAYRGQGFPFAPAASEELPAWLGEPALSAPRLHTGSLLLVTTASEAAAFLRPQPPESFTRARLEEYVGSTFADPDAALRYAEDRVTGEETAYEALVAATTLAQFTSTAYELAAAATVPAGHVRLDVRSPLPRALAPHCFTLPFLFGDRAAWLDAPMLDGFDDELFERTRCALQDEVIAFVRGVEGSTPRWRRDDPRLLAIGSSGAAAARYDSLSLLQPLERSPR
ncbi:carboxylesterase family protein [Nocardioides nematodiphilus]|uniref:carboxylesterase family protein n=1 Tax=Nocardioides nematodiphilus TaxID=2849669 RepID=UPI001CD994EB|nr:carboxylesterase family protein [Nocardioides nematodiphilus]